MKNLTIKILKYCFLMIASTLIVSIANAEETPPSLGSSDLSVEEENPSENDNVDLKNVEKIKVTGSRIKRIDLEGLNPVTSFSAEDLESSGYNSVGDFLRDTNISPFGVTRGRAGSSKTGDSYTEINGEATLILINGLRVSKDPEVHEVDLNQIPINAIEKVDILKGGASAIYGSDAIGGVINFIIKKDISGVQVFGSVTPTLYPLYRGSFKGISQNSLLENLDNYFAGSEASASMVFGEAKSNWSYIGNVTARYQDNIRLNQRVWGANTTSGISEHASFYAPGTYKYPAIYTNCETLNKERERCRFDYTPYADLMPKYAQLNGFFSGEYKTNEITFYTQILGSYKWSQYFYAPIPVSEYNRVPIEISEKHAIPELTGQRFILAHRFIEAGRRDTPINYWMGDMTVGAKGYLSKVWDYDFSLKGSHSIKNTNQKNVLLRDKVEQAITDGAYNPLNPTKEALKEALYDAKSKTNSSLVLGSTDFSGQLGGFDLATGFQGYFERYSNLPDEHTKNNNVLSAAGSEGKGHRYVASYYLEAVKDFNSILELQLAWRADYYSDLGFTNFGLNDFIDSDSSSLDFLDYLIGTPKLAFRFQPDSRIMFRGSVGSSFKAPELDLLYGSSSYGFPSLFDTLSCLTQIKQVIEKDLVAGLEPKGEKGTKEYDDSLKELNDSKEAVKRIKQNDAYDDYIKYLVVYDETDILEKIESSEEFTPELKKIIVENAIDDIKGVKYLSGGGSCARKQYNEEKFSNKELQEVRAITASIGSAVELVEDVNLSVDLIYIAKNNDFNNDRDSGSALGNGKDIFDYEVLKGADAVKDLGFEINRDSATNKLINAKTKIINLGATRKLLLDFNFNLEDIKGLSTIGRSYWNNNFTIYLIHKEEKYPDFIDEIIGDYGKPRWRNASTFGWKNNKHHVSLKAFSVASFRKAPPSSNYFPLHTRFDLTYEHQLTEKTNLQLNVYNFLNLGLDFKSSLKQLASVSLDIPYDLVEGPLEERTNTDIFGINGAYFTAKVAHFF